MMYVQSFVVQLESWETWVYIMGGGVSGWHSSLLWWPGNVCCWALHELCSPSLFMFGTPK
jgi:hypothetical protein